MCTFVDENTRKWVAGLVLRARNDSQTDVYK